MAHAAGPARASDPSLRFCIVAASSAQSVERTFGLVCPEALASSHAVHSASTVTTAAQALTS
jgi:hypothetical protein